MNIISLILFIMKKYNNNEKLILEKQISVTRDVYKILRREKTKQNISMAKIICNLVIEKYDNN